MPFREVVCIVYSVHPKTKKAPYCRQLDWIFSQLSWKIRLNCFTCEANLTVENDLTVKNRFFSFCSSKVLILYFSLPSYILHPLMTKNFNDSLTMNHPLRSYLGPATELKIQILCFSSLLFGQIIFQMKPLAGNG